MKKRIGGGGWGGEGRGCPRCRNVVTHRPAVPHAHLHKTDNARSKTRNFDLVAAFYSEVSMPRERDCKTESNRGTVNMEMGIVV